MPYTLCIHQWQKSVMACNEGLQDIPKLQEVAGHKQAKARMQGYDGNTNNAPLANQQATNRAS
jgi:hypothetical protein